MEPIQSLDKALDDLIARRDVVRFEIGRLEPLRAEDQQLTNAIDALAAIKASAPAAPSALPPTGLSSTPRRRTKVMPTLIEVVKENPNKSMHANEWTLLVAARMNLTADNPQNSIATALLRLSRRRIGTGMIKKHGNNVFEYVDPASGYQGALNGASGDASAMTEAVA